MSDTIEALKNEGILSSAFSMRDNEPLTNELLVQLFMDNNCTPWAKAKSSKVVYNTFTTKSRVLIRKRNRALGSETESDLLLTPSDYIAFKKWYLSLVDQLVISGFVENNVMHPSSLHETELPRVYNVKCYTLRALVGFIRMMATNPDNCDKVDNKYQREYEKINTKTEISDELSYNLSLETKSSYSTKELEYKPAPRKEPVKIDSVVHFQRDVQIGRFAREQSGWSCEVDSTHPTFISKTTGKDYVECHHLIPLAFSGLFEVSLDVPANVVCLCSNCHNQIHYGADIEDILRSLYEKRKHVLSQSEIDISYEELCEMYGL